MDMTGGMELGGLDEFRFGIPRFLVERSNVQARSFSNIIIEPLLKVIGGLYLLGLSGVVVEESCQMNGCFVQMIFCEQ